MQAFQRVIIQIKPAIARYAGQLLGKRLHTHNVLGHETQHGRTIERIGQSFDGVGIIIGLHRPVAGFGEIRYLPILATRCGTVEQVQRPPRRIAGKRRVRLVAQILAQAKGIAGKGQGLISLLHLPLLCVQVSHLRKILQCLWQQFIGTLEKVVTHGRIVYLHDEQAFIRGVGDGRIQMLGRSGRHHRLVGQQIFSRGRVWVIPGRLATTCQQHCNQWQQKSDGSGCC